MTSYGSNVDDGTGIIQVGGIQVSEGTRPASAHASPSPPALASPSVSTLTSPSAR